MEQLHFQIQNPISPVCYADPEARFYEGQYVIYVTVSQPFAGQLNQDCLTSTDLTHWQCHHGVINMSTFPWVKKAVWAPTVVEKNGKYYYIFASNDIHSDDEIGGLEIAVSDSPTGPFRAMLDGPLIGSFHNGAQPIDAHLFKDDDGTVYLFYGGWRHCNVAVMNETMDGFVPFSDGSFFREVTPPDYVEAPCMFRRNDQYYFLWSAGNWTDGTYRVNAARAATPLGPFDDYREILSSGDGSIGNGPGHNGFLHLEQEDLWLMVYHRHAPEISAANARFLCIDPMEFDADGNILPIVMTNGWEFRNGQSAVL